MTNRIIFTGDSFRTTVGEPNQITNVAWLEEILGEFLRETTGLPSINRLPIVTPSMSEFISLQGGEASLDGWARVFWARPTDALVSAISNGCADAVVVGFELPPILISALELSNVPWIDVSISPLRFLPDWALHVRTSKHFDLKSTVDAIVTPNDISEAVSHVSRWYGTAAINMPARVFFAQTSYDRSLIKNGRFCGIEDLSEIAMPDFVKLHPSETDSQFARHLIKRGAIVTNEETYAMLANPNVEVVTFSSSVGREALAFGRKSTILHPSVQTWMYSGVDVLHHWNSHLFWQPLLTSGGLPVRPVFGASWRRNKLRCRHGGQGLSMSVWA